MMILTGIPAIVIDQMFRCTNFKMSGAHGIQQIKREISGEL